MNNTKIIRTIVAAALLVSAIGLVSLAASAGTDKGQKDFTIGNREKFTLTFRSKPATRCYSRGCTSSNTSLTAMITW